ITDREKTARRWFKSVRHRGFQSMKTGRHPCRMALANRLSVRHKSGAALQQSAHSIDLLE
ncbi:MAG: hypothetical protein KAX60_04925, partial [Azonexus sp.]|nr:hypothetical protein [Azonexus sp.]